MKGLAILSILAGLGVMPNSPRRLANPFNAHPVHARYTTKKPTATRNRKNTGSGAIKAKRASIKSANVKRNKARH